MPKSRFSRTVTLLAILVVSLVLAIGFPGEFGDGDSGDGDSGRKQVAIEYVLHFGW